MRVLRIAILAVGVLSTGSACLASADGLHVVSVPFEKGMSWSGVVLPQGREGELTWGVADGGKPGPALRVTANETATVEVHEIRTLMLNHEPGTAAHLSLDVRADSHPVGAECQFRWFDGYVCAEAFYRSPDDPLAPFPAPVYRRTETPDQPGWERVEFLTPPLRHGVLTLAFILRQPAADPNATGTEPPLDYRFDNLEIRTAPSVQYRDPGFDWGGRGGGTMREWRWVTAGAHVDWCDFFDEYTDAAVAYWPDPGEIDYTLESFRDSGSRLLHVKHDVQHNVSDVAVGGAGTISLMRDHPGNVPASWGVRQTVGYAALGLADDEPARVTLRGRYTLYSAPMGRAYLQIGCDPFGGVLSRDILWSAADYGAKWQTGLWKEAELAFDRPPGARAFTVFFRCRDGLRKQDGTIVATGYGSRAIADWIVIEATPGGDADR